MLGDLASFWLYVTLICSFFTLHYITLHYMWLWNRDSKFTKWQHPAMWHVALGWHAIEFSQTSAILEHYIWFDFDHITAVDMSFCTSLRNFIQIGPPSAEKNDVMSIFKMADLSHLWFYGSNNGFFAKPMCDFNIHRSSKLLSFWENRIFLHFGDRQTDIRTDVDCSIDALSRSRCRERRLNKVLE